MSPAENTFGGDPDRSPLQGNPPFRGTRGPHKKSLNFCGAPLAEWRVIAFSNGYSSFSIHPEQVNIKNNLIKYVTLSGCGGALCTPTGGRRKNVPRRLARRVMSFFRGPRQNSIGISVGQRSVPNLGEKLNILLKSLWGTQTLTNFTSRGKTG